MSLTVLIIDDSMTVRAIIEEILSNDRDIRVIGSACDIETARALIMLHHPSVITLDLAMPGIDGMTFLRELPESLHTPILVVSSLTRPGSEACSAALKHGATACFDKAQLVSHAKDFRKVLFKSMHSLARPRGVVQRLSVDPGSPGHPAKARA